MLQSPHCFYKTKYLCGRAARRWMWILWWISLLRRTYRELYCRKIVISVCVFVWPSCCFHPYLFVLIVPSLLPSSLPPFPRPSGPPSLCSYPLHICCSSVQLHPPTPQYTSDYSHLLAAFISFIHLLIISIYTLWKQEAWFKTNKCNV